MLFVLKYIYIYNLIFDTVYPIKTPCIIECCFFLFSVMYETSTYELKEQMYSPVQVGRKVLVVNSLGSELSYLFFMFTLIMLILDRLVHKSLFYI